MTATDDTSWPVVRLTSERTTELPLRSSRPSSIRRVSASPALRGLIEGSGWDGDDFVVAEWDPANVPGFMVRTQRWKLMFGRSPDASSVDALYDLEYDPLEISNVIGQQREQAQALNRWVLDGIIHVESFLPAAQNAIAGQEQKVFAGIGLALTRGTHEILNGHRTSRMEVV